MNEDNIYKSPQSHPIEQHGESTVNTGPFALKGRLNRVQYIAYTMGLAWLIYFVFSLLIGIVSGALGETDTLDYTGAISSLLFALLGMSILGFTIICAIRRSHDFDKTGWLSILAVLPLANLIFWFVPGTHGSNRFGEQPSKSSLFLTIVAIVMPLLFILGIFSAIAIPAYQDYVARAQVGECFTTTSELKTLVAQTYQSTGYFVTQSQVAQLPNGGTVFGRYCQSSIDFSQKAIVSTLGNDDSVAHQVRGANIQFSVDIENVMKTGLFEFSCTSSNLESRFLPRSCSGINESIQ